MSIFRLQSTWTYLCRYGAIRCRESRLFTSHASSANVFREGDVVLLQDIYRLDAKSLTNPLVIGKKTSLSPGEVKHSDIVGQSPGSILWVKKARGIRLLEPSLADYVRFTPRIVTPIYPQIANVIVSLLDLHVSPSTDTTSTEPLHILEAGSGHGSLTLHLARAIHAANCPAPIPPSTGVAELEGLKDDSDARQYEEDLAIWKRSRLAYISSVEISSAHLQVAQRTVRNFRRGMYHGNVDFFKSRLSDWLEARQLELGPSTPFLDHALLDMAPANDHLQLLSSAVKPGGFVTVFYPSITQVLKCFEMVKKDKLPYFLDKVLELDNSNVGGREWDLRTAPIRSKQNEAPAEGHTDVPETTTNSEATTGIVCKPHFGHDRLGTSFLGLFRRLEI